MRAHIPGGIRATGGSISRPPETLYREAADLAYYFHWARGDIMAMTGRERNVWISQISRIHREQKAQRDREAREQTERLLALRADE